MIPMPVLCVFGIDDAVFWAIMWYIAQVAIAVGISYGIAELTKKDPAKADPALPKVTTVEQGRSFPIPFGTPERNTGLMLFWWGDVYLYERERHDVTAYVNYYWGAHVGVCAGICEGLDQFWYGEKCAWPVADDPTTHAAAGQTTALVDASALYGSPYAGGSGGIKGTIDIEYGAASQTRNAYLQSELGDGPAFRGFLGMVFRATAPATGGHFWWGNSPYPQTMGVLVHRQGIYASTGTAIWYAAKAAIGRDMNPAHMLYEALTDTSFGDARAAELLGSSFTLLADDLYTEGLGLSSWYVPGPGRLADWTDEILETVDGFLYEDHATGKLEAGLCRGDYIIQDLPQFDGSDFEILSYQEMGWGDLAGRVIIKYRNRYYPDAVPTAVYEDGNILVKQGGRAQEIVETRAMVYSDSVANGIVARRGVAATYRLAAMTLRCKRTMADLHVGSVFNLSYADTDLAITTMAVRVMQIVDNLFVDGSLEMDVVQDVWGAAYTVYGDPPATEMSTPQVVFSTSATPSASPSSSASDSPSTSVSVTPSASLSASASVTPSSSKSASPSTSKSASPSSSASV